MLSGSTGLFAGMLAFHSPLIPPATRAIWCHHGGRIATEDDTARISVFFGANDRPDDLADRLSDLGIELIDHSWIFASIKQKRKLDLKGFKFSRTRPVASPGPARSEASVPQKRSSVEPGADATSRCDGEVVKFAKRRITDERFTPPPSSPICTRDHRAILSETPGARQFSASSSSSALQTDSSRSGKPSAAEHVSGTPARKPGLLAHVDEGGRDEKCSHAACCTVQAPEQPVNELESGVETEERVVKLEYEGEEKVTSHPLVSFDEDSCRLSIARAEHKEATTRALPVPSQPGPDAFIPDSTSRPLPARIPADVWSELLSPHSSSASTDTVTIPASTFLNAFRCDVAGQKMVAPPTLRYGLSLVEHGRNGFKAIKRSEVERSLETQAAPTDDDSKR